jgi:hypothetical protein
VHYTPPTLERERADAKIARLANLARSVDLLVLSAMRDPGADCESVARRYGLYVHTVNRVIARRKKIR